MTSYWLCSEMEEREREETTGIEGQIEDTREEFFKKINTARFDLKGKIRATQHQINVLLMKELSRKIKYARQNFFENSNKPGRWLAYRLRKGNKLYTRAKR